MSRNNDVLGTREVKKLFDTLDPYDLTPGFKPVPVTCPKCGNYKDNTRFGIDVQVNGMPKRELYTCHKCGHMFNNPPQE